MIIYCDGGTRGNVICLVHGNKTIIKKRGKNNTNNELEYLAIIYTLEYIHTNNLKDVRIYSDSKLIVNQINGEWRVTTDSLCRLYHKSIQKMTKCCGVQICWIKRDKNKAGRHLEKIKFSLR